MKKIVSILVIVILCISAVGIFIYSGRDKSTTQYDVDELNSKLHDIATEQAELRDELESLSASQSAEMNGKGTVSILFNGLYPYIYSDIYPSFSENGFVGVLGLSTDSMPGLSGCMSVKQFDSLIDNGWVTALVYDGETPLSDWLTSMKSLTKKYSLLFPTTMYFVKDVYTKDFDDTLKKFGIKTVIHHGEESLPLVSTDVKSDFFYLASIGWNSVNAHTRLKSAMDRGASLLFTIGEDVPAEVYKSSSFPNMIKKLVSYTKSETLFVATPDEAEDYRKGIGSARDESYEKYENDIEELQKKIDDLDEKKKAIVAEYTN
jgi:hypothetical protein